MKGQAGRDSGTLGSASYVDDLVLACETYEECKEALLYLISLARMLARLTSELEKSG